MYSGSVDAAGVSVSRACNVLNELSLNCDEGMYTWNHVIDALLRVAARTKEDKGDEVFEMMSLITTGCMFVMIELRGLGQFSLSCLIPWN